MKVGVWLICVMAAMVVYATTVDKDELWSKQLFWYTVTLVGISGVAFVLWGGA